MVRFAISAIGRDRPGIVAAVTGVLMRHEANVEDSQMTILRGHFTMVLFVAASGEIDLGRLSEELAQRQTGLDHVSLTEVGELPEKGVEPSHMVSVYGADHPGIVHAVSLALAERQIDITDLNSRLLEKTEPLYVLMLEIALPAGASAGELSAALAEVGGSEGVEVTLRELDRDEL